MYSLSLNLVVSLLEAVVNMTGTYFCHGTNDRVIVKNWNDESTLGRETCVGHSNLLDRRDSLS